MAPAINCPQRFRERNQRGSADAMNGKNIPLYSSTKLQTLQCSWQGLCTSGYYFEKVSFVHPKQRPLQQGRDSKQAVRTSQAIWRSTESEGALPWQQQWPEALLDKCDNLVILMRAILLANALRRCVSRIATDFRYSRPDLELLTLPSRLGDKRGGHRECSWFNQSVFGGRKRPK